MKNFKITRSDIVLVSGFIFCCLTVGYLSWSINGPVDSQNLTAVVWPTNDITCIAKGYHPWQAVNGVCRTEDGIRK